MFVLIPGAPKAPAVINGTDMGNGSNIAEVLGLACFQIVGKCVEYRIGLPINQLPLIIKRDRLDIIMFNRNGEFLRMIATWFNLE